MAARFGAQGVIACEENDSENSVNELGSVDWALSEGRRRKGAHARLEALENAIERLESGLESVFRRLIQTRASLLNIICSMVKILKLIYSLVRV